MPQIGSEMCFGRGIWIIKENQYTVSEGFYGKQQKIWRLALGLNTDPGWQQRNEYFSPLWSTKGLNESGGVSSLKLLKLQIQEHQIKWKGTWKEEEKKAASLDQLTDWCNLVPRIELNDNALPKILIHKTVVRTQCCFKLFCLRVISYHTKKFIHLQFFFISINKMSDCIYPDIICETQCWNGIWIIFISISKYKTVSGKTLLNIKKKLCMCIVEF